MARIGSLVADLKLESAAFIRDMKKAQEATARNTSAMQRSLAGLQRSFAAVGAQVKTFIAGFVSVQAVRSLAQFGRVAIDNADSIAKQARAIGIAGEEFQKLRFAGQLAGVEIAQLDTAIGLFVKNLGNVKVGQGALFSALKNTNPELVRQLQSTHNVSDALSLYLKAIEDADSATERARLGSAAFGRQWLAISKLIADGASEFERAKQRAQDLGFVLSTDVLLRAERLQDEMTELNEAVKLGFARGFIIEFTDALRASDETLKQINDTAAQFGKASAAAFKFVRDTAVSISGALETINRELKPISDFLDRIALVRPARPELPELSFEAMQEDLGDTTAAFGDFTNAIEENQKQIGAWRTTIEAAQIPEHITLIGDTLKSMGDAVAFGFTNAIVEGQKFRDMLDALLRDLSRLALNAVFRQLLSNIIGQPSAAGQAPSGLLGMFHGGGIVGQTAVPMRSLPGPIIAPRLHNGLMPDEFPAILQKGERVIPKMEAVGSNVVINIVNEPGIRSEQQERGDGSVEIRNFIDEAMASNAARRDSRFSRVQRLGGVQTPLTRR